jgi:excinuclease ABC subunit C
MSKSTDRLRGKVDALPTEPGIYLMKDSRAEVIYVGKAKDLRARVRSYFQQAGDDDRLITRQIADVADVDVVVAGSEKEALILETNFIKQFRPKYNVLFRDDKSFVSIKIPLDEPWPRPIVTRKLDDERALYFGPYAGARAARQTLRVLQDVFPLRKCSMRQCREAKRPCIYGEMGKCLAPCCAEVSEEQYKRLIEQVTMFLRGKSDDLIGQLREQMREASEGRDYERAARLRDRIQAIETTLEKQRVGSSAGDVDRDIFGLAATDRSVWTAVLFVRNGNVQDVASYKFNPKLAEPEGIFGSFLNQFYTATRFIPDEVLLPVESDDAALLQEWLSEKKGRKVTVTCPKRGVKRRLVELADRNAREAERISTSSEEKRLREMESLRELLGLSELPRNIECFDISTLGGREAVGSMVVFREGEPDKSSYRRYRIKNVEGQDDFAMMREVVERRCRRAAESAPGEHGLPELIVVDGGRGQLSAAGQALAELGLEACEIVALAKARTRGGEKLRGERVFLPGRRGPIVLPEHSYGYRFITRLRDEAHRFAIAYHRLLRRKAAARSPLTDIPGIGPKIAERLMDHFGTLDKVRGATVDELQAVRGISERLAQVIHRTLSA